MRGDGKGKVKEIEMQKKGTDRPVGIRVVTLGSNLCCPSPDTNKVS